MYVMTAGWTLPCSVLAKDVSVILLSNFLKNSDSVADSCLLQTIRHRKPLSNVLEFRRKPSSVPLETFIANIASSLKRTEFTLKKKLFEGVADKKSVKNGKKHPFSFKFLEKNLEKRLKTPNFATSIRQKETLKTNFLF